MLKRICEAVVTGNYFGLDTRVDGAESLTCADLFAGAGGFTLAAQNVGLDVRFAVESDRHAVESYRENLVGLVGPTLYPNDIRQLSPGKVERDALDGRRLDVLLGGPPCQGFSVHRINNAGVDDPRNELILSYFKFVRHFRPGVFLMENVPGMLWERHSDYIKSFYELAHRAGYQIHKPVVLEAADFGVPQRRKRVFVLGIRNDLEFRLDWPLQGSREQNPRKNEPDNQWRCANTVFAKQIRTNDPNDVHMNHSAEIVEVFKSTPINGGSRKDSKRILPCHQGHDGHKDVYGRIDPAKPGPTMTTACINPSKGRFVHPTEHHGITVRHAARFQTFPDSFEFKGGLIASGMQIGNAVPIVLGEAVIGEIAKALIRNSGN